MSHVYSDDFYDYINVGALRSANRVAPILFDAFQPTSVLDVGCGQGAWLSAWNAAGVEDACGVDGDYVNRDRFLADAARFTPADLTKPFDLNRRFDLVHSLEVAEHLPESAAATFVKSLVAHADIVVFSAARPG